MVHDENIVVLLLLFHKDSGDYKKWQALSQAVKQDFYFISIGIQNRKEGISAESTGYSKE